MTMLSIKEEISSMFLMQLSANTHRMTLNCKCVCSLLSEDLLDSIVRIS
jgi:hypothetical protein